MQKRGRFITFEGTDGCGKSTQMQEFLTYLEKKDIPTVYTREPGGTPIGEELRKILLANKNNQMTPIVELLLMTASRVQHITEIIEPALKQGTWVICDRFSDATIAYQGYGENLDLELINDILIKSGCTIRPDITFFIDIDVEKGLQRVPGEKDRFEAKGLAFLNRVRKGYQDIAAKDPERVKVLDGTKDIATLHKEICSRTLDSGL